MTDIFVFGSNREGRHGAGAALYALRSCGAVYGRPRGLQGLSYAIVTKELRSNFPPVTLPEIAEEVADFLEFARSRSTYTFRVTAIGCGLAGFAPEVIAPMFRGAPPNVVLPAEFMEKPS